MKEFNIQKWLDFYNEENFDEKFSEFIKFLTTSYENYSEYSVTEILNISQNYFEFWGKTILLCKYFLCDNLIILDNEKDIVTFLISSGILKHGKNFYLLHKKMKTNKNYKTIPKKYFNNSYVRVFEELKIFFKTKNVKETNYELDS